MATRFYFFPLRRTGDPQPSADAGWEAFDGSYGALEHRIGFGHTPMDPSSKAGPGVSGQDRCNKLFVSRPLAAQTISGTTKGMIRALESANADNYNPAFVARVVSGDGLTVRGTLLAVFGGGTEFPITTASSVKFPAGWISPGTTLTSVTAQDGDRISLEVGFRATSTSVANDTLRFGKTTGNPDLTETEGETTDNNPWIEFSQDLLFLDQYAVDQEILQHDLSGPSWDFGPSPFREDPFPLQIPVSADIVVTQTASGLLTLTADANAFTEGMPPTIGALTLTAGVNAFTEGMAPTIGVLNLTADTNVVSESMLPTVGILTLTAGTHTVQISNDITINAPAGILTLTSGANAIQVAVAPAIGTLNLAGLTPTIAEAFSPSIGLLQLTGGATVQISESPTVGVLTLTSNVHSIARGVSPIVGILTLTSDAHTLVGGTQAEGEKSVREHFILFTRR